MISAIEPSNTGTTLLTQSSTTALPQTTVESIKLTNNNLIPMTTQSVSSSLTENLNRLISLLQNLIASIGSMFAGNLGSASGNSTNTGTVKPGTNNAGQFDFLRQVDQEPVTVIPTSTNRTGAGSLNDTVANSSEATTVVGNTNPTKQTTTKKPATKKTAPKKTDSKKNDTDKAPKRTTLAKSNGEFLWKPKSDKDGKLAILLPKSLTGRLCLQTAQKFSPKASPLVLATAIVSTSGSPKPATSFRMVHW